MSVHPRTPYAALTVPYLLLGAGLGLINPPITNTAVSGMPPEQAGVAGAIASTARQVGNALGVAVLGSMISHTGAADRFTGTPWLVASCCGLVCAAAAVAGTRPHARPHP